MNNKALNREFAQKFQKTKKTGFTDSEDDDDSIATKTPVSDRSSASGKSSLLSGRSSREELFSNKKRTISGANLNQKDFKSTSKNDASIDFIGRDFRSKSSSPKSPKSPKSSISLDRSGDKDEFKPKNLNQTTRISNKEKEKGRHYSSGSPSHKNYDDDDINNIDMLQTMRRPLGPRALKKTLGNSNTFGKDQPEQKSKDSLFSKKPKEASTWKSKTVGLSTDYRNELNQDDQDNVTINHSFSKKDSFMAKSDKGQLSNKNGDDLKSTIRKSPRDSLEDNESKESSNKTTFVKNVTILGSLINPNASSKIEKSREIKAKSQTESTKKLEEAIEKVEEATVDSIRLNELKQKTSELKYPTKPSIIDTQSIAQEESENKIVRHRANSESARESDSKKIHFNDKYANVKPKIITRLNVQSACDEDSTANAISRLNTSQTDTLNDSYSIRQSIYNDWYSKKLALARQQLKEAQVKKQDEEEKKAQEMIDKLKKSDLKTKEWSIKKENELKEKQKQMAMEAERRAEEEKAKNKEKKEENKLAYEKWKEIKKNQIQKDKEESLKEEREKHKKIRTNAQNKENSVKHKPPLPFDEWKKVKNSEEKRKRDSTRTASQEKERLLEEKEKKKQIAKQSYEEWLDKKEKEEEQKLKSSRSLNESLSSSMSSLPPFYPTSKTIPFGR